MSHYDYFDNARRLRDQILDARLASMFTAVETKAQWQAVVAECEKAVSALFASMGNRVHGRREFSFLDMVDSISSAAKGQVRSLAQ